MNELCSRYHISCKTVHFYIQCGLLHPQKLDNNYYRFSAENEEELKLILRMRKAGISIEGIQDMIKYPVYTNFFLFRQRVLLKKEICRKKTEEENIERIFDLIPPNSTPDNIMALREDELCEEENVFDQQDAYLTARMTAIFLFTPFMLQKVDDYRQFIWNKIVSITQKELYGVLPAIADHLSTLTSETANRLSCRRAYRFLSVMDDEMDENAAYLLGVVHR